MRIRNYIFDVWKRIALSFGYEEYDFPFLEPRELYEAKSGEELVNNQLYWLEDKGGRTLAVRPEKTPTLARMVAAQIKELPRPIRWFNIGNCWRYERPQTGRGREFFQFDCDILGVPDISADTEVYSIPVEVMKTLGAKKGMFEIRVCNRKLAEYYLANVVGLEGNINEKMTQMNRVATVIDKKAKLTEKAFVKELEELNVTTEQIQKINNFIEGDLNFLEQYRQKSEGVKETLRFFELIDERGYADYFKFSPEIMRQFDYSTGIVIEQFDLNPQNNRSMFGGERYDDLVALFSTETLTGTGFAMGDVTLLEFLKGWNLLPTFTSYTEYFVTLWPENDVKYQTATLDITVKLRNLGKNTQSWLERGTRIDKQLKYADKKGIPFVVILGQTELETSTITIKDMRTGNQETKPLDKFINELT